MRSKLRRYLDGVVAALRVAVLHVSVAFVAHAGARVVQIGTCCSQRHMTGWILSRRWSPSLTFTFGSLSVVPVLVAELLWPSSEYWYGYCRGSSYPGKYCTQRQIMKKWTRQKYELHFKLLQLELYFRSLFCQVKYNYLFYIYIWDKNSFYFSNLLIWSHKFKGNVFFNRTSH